jgi:MFS family permease
MYSTLAALLRLRSLPRRDELDDRTTVLALFARFTDELGSGLLVVLMPTLRTRLGLSVAQVGWCFQALATAGAVVEPLSAVAVDVVRRRPLLVAGAVGWAAALLLAAGAGSGGGVLVAFALAGAAYGPLANTADVVLIEGHPDAAERISGRATVVDTAGALLAPAAVAVALWAGFDPRGLLVAAGLVILGYAVALSRAVVPASPAAATATTATTAAVDQPLGTDAGSSGTADVRQNLRDVLGDPVARRWAGTLVLVELLTLNEVFEPVHLASVAGLSQALVGVHVAIATAASLVALLVLDRWLSTHDAGPVLVASAVATLVTYPLWLSVSGAPAKFAVAVVHEAAAAPLWPILHARALAAVPGRAGAMTAIVAVVGFLPLHALFGWSAERIGLTGMLLGTQVGATLALLGLLYRLRQQAAERMAP